MKSQIVHIFHFIYLLITWYDVTCVFFFKPNTSKMNHLSLPKTNKTANLPSKTSVLLLNDGTRTTSSYVTRSSWSNTAEQSSSISLASAVQQLTCGLALRNKLFRWTRVGWHSGRHQFIRYIYGNRIAIDSIDHSADFYFFLTTDCWF